MGILLVYDVTDEKSFSNIRNWIRNIEQHATESVSKMLIGNKCDMAEKRVRFFSSSSITISFTITIIIVVTFFFFSCSSSHATTTTTQVVTPEQGQSLADEYHIPFMETSAKNSINVEKAFFTLASIIKKRIIDNNETSGAPDNTVVVNGGHSGSSSEGGCAC